VAELRQRSSTVIPPAELRRKGIEALVRELGYADAMRFIHQFDLGHGDYTTERRTMLPPTSVDELIADADRLAGEKDPG
jgi:hypothetical protein